MDPGKRIATVEGKLDVRPARDEGDLWEFGAEAADFGITALLPTDSMNTGAWP